MLGFLIAGMVTATSRAMRSEIAIPTVPGSVPLAEVIDHRSLMLCGRLGGPFPRDGWTYEPKIDGYRLLAYRIGAETRLLSRNGNEFGYAFPKIVAAVARIPFDCIPDGELTVSDAEGKPDWHAMRPRVATKRPDKIQQAAAERPATLYLFDVLAWRKRDLRPASFASRRRALEALIDEQPQLRIVGQWADGPALFKSLTAHGLEGVVGKRLTSSYVAGRSKDWLKVRASTAREQSRR
jgi:bifunctional non-homologous end joining protein LigD